MQITDNATADASAYFDEMANVWTTHIEFLGAILEVEVRPDTWAVAEVFLESGEDVYAMFSTKAIKEIASLAKKQIEAEMEPA